MGLLVIVAAALLGFVTWHSEASIRIAGYILQFIGMVFAIRGLLGIRTHFGQPLLRRLLLDWVKRFPKWKRNIVIFHHTDCLCQSFSLGVYRAWNPVIFSNFIQHGTTDTNTRISLETGITTLVIISRCIKQTNHSCLHQIIYLYTGR
uniref:Hypothetical methyl-accepting chemotaxis protein n=1 Tax=uncultured organism TaxID=155900 RepID=K7NAB5_9ZZZZ|nr:hypothetical methyl-accepting chemotaxis protein [uncultured organism]